MFMDFKSSEHERNATDVLRWAQWSVYKEAGLGPSCRSANWISNQIDYHEPMILLQKTKRAKLASCSGVNLHANTHNTNMYVHIKPLKSIFDPAQKSQQT
jgi:hypothetical protein